MMVCSKMRKHIQMGQGNIASGRKLLSNTAFYAFADLIGKGLHFILLPLYTAFLTTTDYGIQNMVTSFNSVLNYVVLLCLDAAALKYYSEYSGDEKRLKRFYGTAMSIVCVFAVVVIVVCLLSHTLLEKFVFEGVDFVPYVLLGLAVLMLDSVYTLHRRMLEAQQKGRKVATIGVIAVVFSSATTLVMIGIFKLGALGVLMATLFTSIGTVIFVAVDIWRNKMMTICFDKVLAKRMLSYSLPLIPHQLSGPLAALIGRIFLNTTGSLAVVGLYGVATQFSSVVDVFQDATSRAFRPWLFGILNHSSGGEYKEKIRNISCILVSLYSIVTVGMGLFAQEIITVMTADSYYGAWLVIPVLVLAVSVKSIYYFYFAQCLFYPGTSRYIFIASITANLCNIIAAAALVPVIGMYGSAIAAIVSIIVNSSIIYLLNRKNGEIGYSLPKLFFRLLLSWFMIGIGVAPSYLLFESGTTIVNVIYKIIVMFIYVGLIWIINRTYIYAFTGTKNVNELIKMIRRNKN